MPDRKPCEYCGEDLPEGVDKNTRRIRSHHFANCKVRQQIKEQEAQDEINDKADSMIDDLQNNGFTAEQAVTLVRLFGGFN